MPFVRTPPVAHTNRAVIVWLDDVLVRSKSRKRPPVDAHAVEIGEAIAAALRRDREEGNLILGLSWQPEIAAGARTAESAAAVFKRMNELAGFPIEVEYCAHPSGPPTCWCRTPLPGLGVLMIQRHQLDPLRCVYIGDGAADPGYARKLGFTYRRLNGRDA
ncbi:MAG: hypothetical protein K2Y23_22250 [Cyanobacteria bacterium]|nr:hypothetical protein [Cyanobacteriota bacterium]